MALTKDEKEMLAKYRAQKKLEGETKEVIDFSKPQLIGYAKEDLYNIGVNVLKEVRDGCYGWFLTKNKLMQYL